MKTTIIIYSVLCLMYGLRSLYKHQEKHRYHTEWWRMLLVFILNSVFTPVCMFIERYKSEFKYNDIYIHNRWKDKPYSRSGSWVFIGIEKRYYSPFSFSYILCFFGFRLIINFHDKRQ